MDARLDELLTLVLDTHAAVENHSRSFDADAHHALARRAAAESAVLLKNDGDLLPLAAGASVAVSVTLPRRRVTRGQVPAPSTPSRSIPSLTA